MKSIVLAFCGSIIAAVCTMFVPTSLLESITGATGLSELVPATAAPLGDTARALIAFGTGIVALIILLALLMRKKSDAVEAEQKSSEDAASDSTKENIGERLSEFKERFAGIRLPQMPWQRSEDDILDLADLPKLRDHDAHPDAPARKPISALSDLADADLTGDAATTLTEPEPTKIKTADMAVAESSHPDGPVAEPIQPLQAQPITQQAVVTEPVSVAADIQPGVSEPVPAASAEPPPLADIVAQLEAAVELRKVQLAKLENEALQLTSEKADDAAAEAVPAVDVPTTAPVEAPNVEAPVASDPVAATRPPLEAVPDAQRPDEDDEMDAALNAALETLQKMNSAAR